MVPTAVLERRLERLLESHATLKLATNGLSGAPWIATTYFAEDGVYVLLLLIEDQGRTIANIEANPNVAVMIERGGPSAPYARGQGHAEIMPQAVDVFRGALMAKTQASEQMVVRPGLVAVRVHVDRWHITDTRAGWVPARVLERVRTSDRTPSELLAHAGR